MRYYKTLLLFYLIAATVLFVGLSILVKTTAYFPLDLQISRNLQMINFPGFAKSMTVLSNSGWGAFVSLYTGLIVLSLFLLGKKLASLFVIIMSLLDMALFFAIANLINRPRPSPDLIRVDFKIAVGGFPSGHVVLDTLIFGFLIYLTIVYVKKLWIKLTLITFFSLIIIFIGIARIYSGQHWPSDILGGYVLGSIWLIISIYFYNLIKGLK